MANRASRREVLFDFDTAREAFEEAVRRAPDAALRYKPAGEDYALGGLVVHVTDVLRRYAQVIDGLRDHQFGPFVAPPRDTPGEEGARIADGFGGQARGPV